MKVLFQCRPSLYTLSGGDKIQILETKSQLEKLGVKVTISITNTPDLTDIDIFHLFNPSLLAVPMVAKARQKKIPVIISTIHWDMKEYYQSIFSTNKEYLRLRPTHFIRNYARNQIYAVLYNYWWYQKNMKDIQKIFSLADVLLPNSNAEIEHIKKYFDVSKQTLKMVPNGISQQLHTSSDTFYNKYKLKDFILCVGRIEYRKNQHLLLQALMNDTRPIVFIGNNSFNQGYTSICRALAHKRGNVYFIPHLGQPELFSAYQNAKIHALISWYETPGLANLEAGYHGCNLALSDRGCTKEYFKEYAEYCNPGDLDSIKKAVDASWNKPQSSDLKKHIKQEYLWEKVGKVTYDVYQELLRVRQ